MTEQEMQEELALWRRAQQSLNEGTPIQIKIGATVGLKLSDWIVEQIKLEVDDQVDGLEIALGPRT